MKILKYLFFLLLIAIIAGAIYVATKKGDYRIEESEVIEAPASVVFNQVNNFKNWEEWGPWRDNADDLIISYGDTLIGNGARYNWKSEEIGDGEIKTIKSNPYQELEQTIKFESKFGESNSDVYWKFDEVENGTKVTWGMAGNQSFMEKLAYTFMDQSYSEMMRPLFKEGLANLKKVVKEKMESYTVNVDGITQHGGGFYMYTTTSSKIPQIQSRITQMFTDVSSYMKENNIAITGKPLVLYNEYNNQNNSAIYSAGMFTPSLVITPAESRFLNGMLPVQQVVKTTLKGDYKNIKEAWDATYAYIQQNGFVATEGSKAFEIYRVNPDDTNNPADWVTEIYIPVVEKTEEIELETVK